MLGSRVPYLERDQASSEIQAVYDDIEATEGRVDNAYKLLAHHEPSFRAFVRWQECLLAGPLDPRLRQLAYVQTSQLNGSRYCVMHNIEIGVRVGVTREKFAALPAYLSSGLFNDLERKVIRYATELTRRIQVDPSLIADLEHRIGAEAFVQLTLAIATANLMNRFNMALNTELESDHRSFRSHDCTTPVPPNH